MRDVPCNVTVRVTVCRRAECSTFMGKNWYLNFMNRCQVFYGGGFLGMHTNTLLWCLLKLTFSKQSPPLYKGDLNVVRLFFSFFFLNLFFDCGHHFLILSSQPYSQPTQSTMGTHIPYAFFSTLKYIISPLLSYFTCFMS